jgi:hypothetical protein
LLINSSSLLNCNHGIGALNRTKCTPDAFGLIRAGSGMITFTVKTFFIKYNNCFGAYRNTQATALAKIILK